METKKCFNCKKSKDVTEFNVDKQKRDGLRSYCVVCSRMIAKETKVDRAKRYAKKAYAKMYREEQRRKKQIETEREERLLKSKQERERNLLARATQ